MIIKPSVNSLYERNHIESFFCRKIILFIAVLCIVQIIFSFVQSILSGMGNTFKYLVIPLSIGNLFYALSMYLFYYNSRHDKTIKHPAKIFYILNIVQSVIVILFAILLFLIITIYAGNQQIVTVTFAICLFFVLANLSQLAFSYSIIKYDNEKIKYTRFLRAAEIFNYVFGFFALAPMVTQGFNYISFISIIINTLLYLSKGVMINQYRKELRGVKNE